jgi:hypothetical protein
MRFNTKRGQDIREYYITLEEIFHSYLISDGSPDFYQNDKNQKYDIYLLCQKRF